MVEEVKETVLIIGSGGMLGRVLNSVVSKNFKTTGLAHADLDITDHKKTIEICRQIRPEIIILSASYTDVDGCEKNKELAYQVNVEGVKNVAQAASEIGSALISMSTDYVFNGKATTPYSEYDKPDPISVYGESKLKGEEAALKFVENSMIIRCSLLFGESTKGFISMVRERIGKNQEVKAIHDKVASPTYVVDLAGAIVQIVQLITKQKYDFKKNRMLHITNKGISSWYDMAEHIFEKLHVNHATLKKVVLDDFPFIAKRPRYSALDCSRYEKITNQRLRPWQDALTEFLQCQKI